MKKPNITPADLEELKRYYEVDDMDIDAFGNIVHRATRKILYPYKSNEEVMSQYAQEQKEMFQQLPRAVQSKILEKILEHEVEKAWEKLRSNHRLPAYEDLAKWMAEDVLLQDRD